MLNITIDEILRDPLKYLSLVKAGETFVIIQADQPIAELKPLTSNQKQRRPSGLCAGEFTVPDDFDEPLPDEILSTFSQSLLKFIYRSSVIFIKLLASVSMKLVFPT